MEPWTSKTTFLRIGNRKEEEASVKWPREIEMVMKEKKKRREGGREDKKIIARVQWNAAEIICTVLYVPVIIIHHRNNASIMHQRGHTYGYWRNLQ